MKPIYSFGQCVHGNPLFESVGSERGEMDEDGEIGLNKLRTYGLRSRFWSRTTACNPTS